MRRAALRIMARLIDLAIAGALPVALIASIPRDAGLEGVSQLLLDLLLSAVWVFVVSPLIEAMCVLQLSATPGMLLTRLRLLDGGSPITLARACTRSFLLGPLLVAGAMAYGVPAVVYAGWLLWDTAHHPDGRTWPDRVSGMTVAPVWPAQLATNRRPAPGDGGALPTASVRT